MAALQIDLTDLLWRKEANCIGRDPEIFFPERGETKFTIELAREICSVCTVQKECLDYALSSPDGLHGIWGGTSGRERRVMRRGRKCT